MNLKLGFFELDNKRAINEEVLKKIQKQGGGYKVLNERVIIRFEYNGKLEDNIFKMKRYDEEAFRF